MRFDFQKIIKNKKIIFPVIICLVVIGYFIFKNNVKKTQQYQTTKVSRETIIETVSASGKIISSSNFSVFTQASGVIKNVFVVNGQWVKKGDKILEIELDQLGTKRQAEAWASYLQAKNSLDSAQTTLYTLHSEMINKWDKFYQLAINSTYQNPDGSPNIENRKLPEFIIAQDEWLAAEGKYKNQDNQVKQAQAALQNAWLNYQLNSSIITAPADGYLTDLIYAPGMVIGSSDSTTSTTQTKIATIKTQVKIFGQFNVSEIDVSKIKSGQKATIIIDALSGKTFTGKVIAIDKTGIVSSSVVNYPLTIEFDEENDEILPNMSASANIVIARKNNVLTVPSSAVVNQNGGYYVRVLKNKQIILMPVEVGISSGTKTEIISGLEEGEEIISSILTTDSQRKRQTQSPFSSFGGGAVFRMR